MAQHASVKIAIIAIDVVSKEPGHVHSSSSMHVPSSDSLQYAAMTEGISSMRKNMVRKEKEIFKYYISMVPGSNATALSNVFCHIVLSSTSPNRTAINAATEMDARYCSMATTHNHGDTSTRHASIVAHATHSIDWTMYKCQRHGS